jgi:hypothetical protein
MKDVARDPRDTASLPRPAGEDRARGEDRAGEIAWPLVERPPSWRSWVAHSVIFCVALVLVVSLFSMMSKFVQKFFMTLYAP